MEIDFKERLEAEYKDFQKKLGSQIEEIESLRTTKLHYERSNVDLQKGVKELKMLQVGLKKQANWVFGEGLKDAVNQVRLDTQPKFHDTQTKVSLSE